MFLYTILSSLISNNKIPRFLFKILLDCSRFAFINFDLLKSQLQVRYHDEKRLNSSKVPNTNFLCFKWEQIIAKQQQQKKKRKKHLKSFKTRWPGA